MNYQSVLNMANSTSLMNRIIAAVAVEGIHNPEAFVNENRWKLAATPGWADDWAYAEDVLTSNQNPDLGARDDVISDAKILAAIQALIAPV